MSREVRMRWYLGLAALGVVVVGLLTHLLLAEADSSSGYPAYEAAEARWHAVKESASVGVAGARLLAGNVPEIQSERGASGNCVTFVGSLRRRWDFSEVPMDDRRGGPVEPLLALAHAQQERLARSGFDVLSATWTTLGLEGRQRIKAGAEDDLWWAMPDSVLPPLPDGYRGPPRRIVVDVEVRNQSDSGNGRGGDQVNLNAPVIVHYRTYLVPRSGVTLFVRNAYDQKERIVESEFTYADRTLHGTPYPTGSYIVGREPGRYSVSERIVLPKQR